MSGSCGPPGPAGPDIQISANNTLIWGQNVGLDSYSWEGQALGPVPGFSLENAQIGIRFRDVEEQQAVSFVTGQCSGHICPKFVLRRRPELHLFERDPRVLYSALTLDPLDNSWGANLRTAANQDVTGDVNVGPPYGLPADVVIPYGEDFTLIPQYPTQVAIPSLQEQDFLLAQNGSTTQLSDWLPDGIHSIKGTHIRAVRLLTLPECSTAVNIQRDVFKPLADQVNGALHCKPTEIAGIFKGEVFPTLVNLYAATYLTHQDPTAPESQAILEPVNPWEGVFGGIMVHGQVFVHTQVDYNTLNFNTEDCTVTFTYDLRYALDADGIFTVTPYRVQLDSTSGVACQGNFITNDSAKQTIDDLFEKDIPNFARGTALQKQQISFPFLSNGTTPNTSWECPFPAPDPAALTEPGGSCSGAAADLVFKVGKGTGTLGFTDSQKAAVNAAINDSRNWRCRAPNANDLTQQCAHGGPVRGICEFVVPAQSVIAEPDEVRIGWAPLNDYESSSEVGPSTVAFAGAVAAGDYRALCTPPTEVSSARPFYERYFATLKLGRQQCTEPPPPLPPPPPLVCPCTGDSECVNGDKCASVNGTKQCLFVCRNDNDCAARGLYPHCFTNTAVPTCVPLSPP